MLRMLVLVVVAASCSRSPSAPPPDPAIQTVFGRIAMESVASWTAICAVPIAVERSPTTAAGTSMISVTCTEARAPRVGWSVHATPELWIHTVEVHERKGALEDRARRVIDAVMPERIRAAVRASITDRRREVRIVDSALPQPWRYRRERLDGEGEEIGWLVSWPGAPDRAEPP